MNRTRNNNTLKGIDIPMNDIPKISDVLINKFMKPRKITTNELALETRVPASRVYDLVHDRRRISADTSIRLGRVFGISPRYFLDLQSDIDIKKNELKNAHSYNKIDQLDHSKPE